jgi:hypothetical protein
MVVSGVEFLHCGRRGQSSRRRARTLGRLWAVSIAATPTTDRHFCRTQNVRPLGEAARRLNGFDHRFGQELGTLVFSPNVIPEYAGAASSVSSGSNSISR